jgi:hypothetical protein
MCFRFVPNEELDFVEQLMLIGIIRPTEMYFIHTNKQHSHLLFNVDYLISATQRYNRYYNYLSELFHRLLSLTLTCMLKTTVL